MLYRFTMGHVKTVTLRELHTHTGKLVRQTSEYGVIRITHEGRVIAKITPETEAPKTPYFARRKLSPAFKRLQQSGKFGSGTDSTLGIHEDREDRV